MWRENVRRAETGSKPLAARRLQSSSFNLRPKAGCHQGMSGDVWDRLGRILPDIGSSERRKRHPRQKKRSLRAPKVLLPYLRRRQAVGSMILPGWGSSSSTSSLPVRKLTTRIPNRSGDQGRTCRWSLHCTQSMIASNLDTRGCSQAPNPGAAVADGRF